MSNSEKLYREVARFNNALGHALNAAGGFLVIRKIVLAHWRENPNRCFYCGAEFGELSPFTSDHMLPRHYGGSRIVGYIVPACFRCNHLKGHIKPNRGKFRKHFPDGKFWAEATYGCHLKETVVVNGSLTEATP